jgi:ABC-type uncharacterized transport system substrate-binding protein
MNINLLNRVSMEFTFDLLMSAEVFLTVDSCNEDVDIDKSVPYHTCKNITIGSFHVSPVGRMMIDPSVA